MTETLRLTGILLGVILVCGAAFLTIDLAAAVLNAPPKVRTGLVWVGVNVAVWTYLALAHSGDGR